MAEGSGGPGDGLLCRVAEALAQASGHEVLSVPLAEGRALLLELARDVAHLSARSNAPVATYLIGRFVERRCRQGSSELAALKECVAVLASLLGRDDVASGGRPGG